MRHRRPGAVLRRAAAGRGAARAPDAGAGAIAGPDGSGHAVVGRDRAGAEPARHHRPRDRRPADVRRPGDADRQRRDLQLPRVARRAAGAWSSPRKATANRRCICAAATAPTSRATCAACTRIAIHDRAARTRHAVARPVRHQAALHRADRMAASPSPRSRRRCSRPGWSRARLRPPARDELLQLQFTTGARDDLHRHQPRAARRDADLRSKAMSSSEAARRRSPRAAPRRSARLTRWSGWTARWRAACCCTSAATCHTACSSRGAWTAPRCWR